MSKDSTAGIISAVVILSAFKDKESLVESFKITAAWLKAFYNVIVNNNGITALVSAAIAAVMAAICAICSIKKRQKKTRQEQDLCSIE